MMIRTMLLALCVAGCSLIPAKVETVYVQVPVPVVPTTPAMPVVPYFVDTLTLADAADPGKVVKAYKHDMYLLRQQVDVCYSTVAQFEEYRRLVQQANKKAEETNK